MIRFASMGTAGDLGMMHPDDNWPGPVYTAGPPLHLHALGVIASAYNKFDDRLFAIYEYHFQRRATSKAMKNIADTLYFRTAEDQRITLIETVFKQFDKSREVNEAIKKLGAYYLWCHKIRNLLIHSTYEPPFFGASPQFLYITKREKKAASYKFEKFGLLELRHIADAIHAGYMFAVDIIWYLRMRDTPRAKWSVLMKAAAPIKLPDIPTPPKVKVLSDIPHTPPPPKRLRRSSPRKSKA
jgi:hypothetical protein